MLESCLIPSFHETREDTSYVQMITSFYPQYPISLKQSISRHCKTTIYGFDCNVYIFHNTPFPNNCSFPIIDSITAISSNNNETSYSNIDGEIQICGRYVNAITTYSNCICKEIFADNKNIMLLENAMILSYVFDEKHNSFYLKSCAYNHLLDEIRTNPAILKTDVESLFYIMMEVSGESYGSKSELHMHMPS